MNSAAINYVDRFKNHNNGTTQYRRIHSGLCSGYQHAPPVGMRKGHKTSRLVENSH